MKETRISIAFDGVTDRRANVLAKDLAAHCGFFGEVSAKPVKPDPGTQDLGTTVLLILGTPVVIELAKGAADGLRIVSMGIADWLCKQNASISLRRVTADGELHVLATGLAGDDAAQIAEVLLAEVQRNAAD